MLESWTIVLLLALSGVLAGTLFFLLAYSVKVSDQKSLVLKRTLQGLGMLGVFTGIFLLFVDAIIRAKDTLAANPYSDLIFMLMLIMGAVFVFPLVAMMVRK